MGRSQRAFDTGLPFLQRGMGMANSAIAAGGEPAFMGRALDASLANAQDATMLEAQAQDAGMVAQNKGVVAGGNVRRTLNPESVGAKMAQLVAQAGAGRQASRIGQIFEAAGVSLGGAGGAADAQTRALSTQLGAISMRPTVDPTYATLVGAANAAGTIYGAANTPWGNGVLQKPLPTATSYGGSFAPYANALQPLPQSTSYYGSPLLQPLPPARRF